jgi:predicted transposase YdaD
VPGPFDTTTKYLVQTYPADWLAFLGLGGGPGGAASVEVMDASIATVSAEVDKVLKVGGAAPWLAHLEFQSSYDATIGQRLARYNMMLHARHDMPVASVLVLLRERADGPAAQGSYEIALPGGQPYLRFSYAVRRIWREPVGDLLAGALGTLPLAPLGEVELDALPDVIRVVDQRIGAEADHAEAARLRLVTYTLLGLGYPSGLVDQLMPGMRSMRDSSTYQAILEEGRAEGRVEGRVEEARALLLELGTRRFGPPDARASATLAAIDDHDRLHALAARLFDAADWSDLLSSQ